MIGKVLKILADRAITTAVQNQDYILRNDGTGPYIAYWNAALLGVQPTQVELDAITEEDAEAALIDSIAAEISTSYIPEAIAQTAFEEIQKCEVLSGQTLRTLEQWKDRVTTLVRQMIEDAGV